MAESNTDRMADKPHVVVVGAGIVGVASAVWLQRDGYPVTILDREGPAAGTSYGNAGVLASNSIIPVTTPGLWKKAPGMLFDPDGPLFLRWPYVPRMVPWLASYMRHCRPAEVKRIASAIAGVVGDSLSEHQQLAQGTPAERWITPSDYVFAYADRPAFDRDAFGWALRQAHGYTWDELDADAFHTYDPTFQDVAEFGVRCPDHGHIKDPGRYVQDLAEHFEGQGGTVRKAEVIDVARADGQVTGVVTADGVVACDRVVLATGAWSKPLARAIG
ncbi:MAG: FAD-dependent oxidoreductase, partial [Pseudomonadota bacterium]